MNPISRLAIKYKQHYYEAEVDKPKGYQVSLVLMGLFLLAAVSIGFSSPGKAIATFVVLSLFLAFFPFIFPNGNENKKA